MPTQPITLASTSSNTTTEISTVLKTNPFSTSLFIPATVNHNVQNYIKELEISEGQLSSCIKYVQIYSYLSF